jgi:hypothetical protein
LTATIEEGSGIVKALGKRPAIVVAALGLVAAVAGTAVAADAGPSAVTKKKVKKIARKQIDKLAPSLSVARAETAGSAESADVASQAQNAATANGVRPVEINFAAPTNTPARTFLNQGGVRVTGQCLASARAQLRFVATANNGLIKVVGVDAPADQDMAARTSSPTALDFDAPGVLSVTTDPLNDDNAFTATVTYRGAGGTTISGELVVAQGAAAGQCVIAGTLLVG